METDRPKVVDLRQFREARDRERLPLFDAEPTPPAGELIEMRPISTRQLEHRERMLRHLGGGHSALGTGH